jgi:hypothetical protein
MLMVMETVRKIEIFFITHSAQVLVFLPLLLLFVLSCHCRPFTRKRLPPGVFFANVHFSSLRAAAAATTTTQHNTNN